MEDGDLRPYLEVAERLIEPVAVAIETPEAAASLLEDLGYILDTQVTAFTELGGGVDNWEEIADKLGDPFKAIDDTLSDADEFAYELLLYLVREFAVALGLPVTYDVPQDGPLAALNDGDDLTQLDNFDELTMLRFLLVSDPAAELAIELYPRIDTATKKRTGLGAGVRFGSDIEIPLGDAFKLVLKIAASLMDSLGVVFKKGQGVQFVNKL